MRIALEIKKDADPKMVMAYLFKNTPLQTNFIVNLTCLIPTENAEVGRPERLDLHQALMYFLQFRLQVVTNRLEHELESLKKRIHILEGFEKVFDALDEIIKIIRKSDGKADSAEKIMKRFGLDAEQADAILELKLYRLARLEILVIQNELADKRKRARQITGLLKDEEGRWKVVRDEIEEIQKKYGGKDDKRRTLIESEEEVSFTADDFIVEEDNVVIVSRDGWVKRQKEVRDVSTTRLREGDSVLAVLQGSTRATVVFFTNFGVAYTSRIIDVPASTGYGEPVQKLFKLRDGEKVIAAFSLDPRVAGNDRRAQGRRGAAGARARRHERRLQPAIQLRVVRRAEHARRTAVRAAVGRRGSRRRRAHHGRRDRHRRDAGRARHPLPRRRGELPVRARQGRHPDQADGGKDDRVLGFIASTGDRDLLRVETSRGSEQTISTTKYEVTGRGGKGRELLQRGQFTRIIPGEVENPQPLDGGG